MATKIEAYHRRFRPNTIADYIGNEKLKQSVKEMFRDGNRPQVLLLQGHSGCGKTTMARLIAKEYCCENRDEEKGACGECDSCKEFNAYIESGNTVELMDLHEINSGKIGKQEAEQIMAEMEAPSISDNWKTYIFDESHLLTAGAMGGLLKMVEEPPEKVLIIFCTTDPDKMLDTILSRCQYLFTVSKPTRNELCTLLAKVCVAEGKKYDNKALSLICTAGDYVPRNTLTSLEKVIRAKGNALYESAVDVLNAISDTYYFKFFEILSKPMIDVYQYTAFLGGLRDEVSLDQFLAGLLSYTKRGLYIYNGVKLDGVEEGEVKQYQKIFSSFKTVDIGYILCTLLEIQKAPDIEARLLLLGYTGIRKPRASAETNNIEDVLKQAMMNPAEDKGTEKNMTADAIKGLTVATEADKQAIVNKAKEATSVDNLMTAFASATQYTGSVDDFA